MTRREAESLVDAIVAIREAVTDDTALTVPAVYPAWRVDVDYIAGTRLRHKGTLYKVLQAHTSQADWPPDAAVSLYAKVLAPGEISPWEQPDSTNPYMSGDKVTYSSKIWESAIDNNVWAPGVYGWKEVT